MIYLDTNVIVYAIENHPKFGEACKRILLDIEKGNLKALSSVMTLAELISVLVKINRMRKSENKSTVDINMNVSAVLSLPVTWIEMDFSVIEKASRYTYKTSGSDYIHAASMDIHGVYSIISADAELDKIDFAKRIDPLEYH